MRKHINSLGIFIFILLLLGSVTGVCLYNGGLLFSSGPQITGKSNYKGLTLEIDQKEGSLIRLMFDNESDTDMNIGGWGESQRACLTTTDGQYWFDFNGHMGFTINAHSKASALLAFNGVSGDFLNLRIDKIQELKGGIPAFGEKSTIEIPIMYESITPTDSSSDGACMNPEV